MGFRSIHAGAENQVEDEFQAVQAEKDIYHVKQRGRPAREYIREFQRVAGQIRQWPEQSLIHYFKAGLEHDLFQMCICRGNPDHDWYRLATNLDIELTRYNKLATSGPRPR